MLCYTMFHLLSQKNLTIFNDDELHYHTMSNITIKFQFQVQMELLKS